jgi:hypothetical protein
MARVWLLQLPEVPRSAQQTLELIRWKIKRSVAFRVEDAVISWQVLSRPSGNDPAVLLVGLLQGSGVHGFEKVFAEAGFKIGLVDLCSFNLYNAYRASIEKDGVTDADFAVLNATETYFTLMIFRAGNLIFYRCKTHTEGEGSTPEQRERTFRRELATSLSYYTRSSRASARRAPTRGSSIRRCRPWRETMETVGFGGIETIDPGKYVMLPDEMDARPPPVSRPPSGPPPGEAREAGRSEFRRTPFRNNTPFYIGYGWGRSRSVAFTTYNTWAFVPLLARQRHLGTGLRREPREARSRSAGKRPISRARSTRSISAR